MKRLLFFSTVICVLLSCENGSGNSTNSEDTTKSITPPKTADTAIAPMMGETSKTKADSLKK